MKKLLIVLTVVAGCTAGSDPTTTSANPTSTSSTAPTPTTTTTTSLVSTTSTTWIPQEAWTEAEAERIVENYLAALAAGAWDVAAFSASNMGIEILGTEGSETPAETLERLCADGACEGPYLVEALGPGLVDPNTSQAASTVNVTHVPSGVEGVIDVFTFEGQQIVADLPPLVSSSDSGTLVESLFGENLPSRVVMERFSGFEIWDDGSSEWVVNWWAPLTVVVEEGVILTSDPWTGSVRMVALEDPRTTAEVECAHALERDGNVYTLDGCTSGDWTMVEVLTGNTVAPAVAKPSSEPEAGYHWYEERAGVAFLGEGDAEGNLISIVSDSGVDLLGDNYAGFTRISIDGTKLAFVDHRDPRALSHFHSGVLVLVDFSTGAELERWELPGIITCLEFESRWIVACLDDEARPEFEMNSIAAIDVATGEINVVATRARIFLPSG